VFFNISIVLSVFWKSLWCELDF